MLRVKVPASTANLGPGFDTLGMALSLFNYVEMEETGTQGELIIEVQGEGAASIAVDEKNVTWQAAQAVFQVTGCYPTGLHIRLHNEIPAARGLGSSAAARVGGLIAANYLVGEPLVREQLLALAVGLEGHPDNAAPALMGGLVAASFTERGLLYRRLEVPAGLQVIVAIPSYELSTQEAVRALPAMIPLRDAVFNLGQACLLITGFLTQDWPLIGQAMEDRIHQPYRAPLIPGLEEALKAARAAGALGAALSGAGPTVLALAIEEEGPDQGNFKHQAQLKKIGEAMREAFYRSGVASTVRILSPCAEGAKLELSS